MPVSRAETIPRFDSVAIASLSAIVRISWPQKFSPPDRTESQNDYKLCQMRNGLGSYLSVFGGDVVLFTFDKLLVESVEECGKTEDRAVYHFG